MKNLILLPLAVSFSVAATAQTTQVDETMVVTANRIEVPLTQVLAPVSVLTSADIERLQITQITDLLSRMTGMEAVSTGGAGSANGIFVRGGDTKHTLVLVDGVRVSSATLGSSALQFLDLSNIDRVELIRGPASSLYGADAISGVLQIITKKSQAETLVVSAGVGSQGWSRMGARVSAGNEQTRVTLGVSREQLNDFDRRELNTFLNGDDDKYRNVQLTTGVTHAWSEKVFSRVSYQLDKADIESDNSCLDAFWSEVACQPFSDNRLEVLNISNSWQLTDEFSLIAQAARSVDSSNNGDYVALASVVEGSDSRIKTTRDSYSLQSNYKVDDALGVVVGAEYYNDKVKSSNDYLATSRDNMAWFGQLRYSLGDHSVQLGLRTDDNEAFGTHNTQSVTWGYQIDHQLRLIASWGTAFRAPSFNDLYWPADPYGIGNPALSPEEGENVDLAIKYNGEHHRASATIFRNTVDGLINWAPVDPNNFYGQWTPSNIDDARMEGFELEYGYVAGSWSANANYSWTDAEDTGKGTRLNDRARRLFHADLDYVADRLTLGASLIAKGDRFSDVANTRRVPGFAVVDVRVGYELNAGLDLSASLTNAFDREYVQREGFNEQGRGFKLGVTYKM